MEITADLIKKYAKYTTPELRQKAGVVFRRFIRIRDEGQMCISCNSWHTRDASHFYSAGHYPALEFNEDNVHLSCASCNRFKGGNLHEYRKRLIKKIGEDRVKALDDLSDAYKKTAYKHDRFRLIEILEEYRCTK
jgi:5-methylcytosine-specific restriction endonuclease McrA